MATEQVKIIRQTENYKIQQDSKSNNRIVDIKAGCMTTWYTGVDAQIQINHIKHLTDDADFDEYCRREFCDIRG